MERKNFMPEPVPPKEEVEEEEARKGWNWCTGGRKLLDTSGDWSEQKATLHRSQSISQALGGASLLPGANEAEAEDLTATARSKVPVGGQAVQPAPSSATRDQKSSLPSLKVAAPQGQSATMHQSNSLPSPVKMLLPPGPVPAAGGSGGGQGAMHANSVAGPGLQADRACRRANQGSRSRHSEVGGRRRQRSS